MGYVYKDISVSYDHHRKRSNGCVNEHLLVAESILGRYLKDSECVHHIDENKWNNSPDNLMIFDSIEDHARFHSKSYGELYQLDDGSWKCIKRNKKCLHCGEIFEYTRQERKYCAAPCSVAASKVCDRPPANELYQLLKNGSFLSVGKHFGVSDNAIRKWCRSYGMSEKSKDYKKEA